jgi:hypothetical protein
MNRRAFPFLQARNLEANWQLLGFKTNARRSMSILRCPVPLKVINGSFTAPRWTLRSFDRFVDDSRAPIPTAARSTKSNAMYANTTPNFRFPQRLGVKAEKPRLARLQSIATSISSISLTVGFLFLGILIILRCDQADLSGISGGSAVAMAAGICAILVGTVFWLSFISICGSA